MANNGLNFKDIGQIWPMPAIPPKRPRAADRKASIRDGALPYLNASPYQPVRARPPYVARKSDNVLLRAADRPETVLVVSRGGASVAPSTSSSDGRPRQIFWVARTVIRSSSISYPIRSCSLPEHLVVMRNLVVGARGIGKAAGADRIGHDGGLTRASNNRPPVALVRHHAPTDERSLNWRLRVCPHFGV